MNDKIIDLPEGPFPITVRLTDHSPSHTRLSIWVNHGLICTPGGICLRNEEVKPFLNRIKPNQIEYSNDRIKAFLETMYGPEEKVVQQCSEN